MQRALPQHKPSSSPCLRPAPSRPYLQPRVRNRRRQCDPLPICRKGKCLPASLRLPALITLCSNALAMNPVPESAAKLQKDSGARLRAIPSVDELLLQPRLVALAEKSGRALVTQAVRQVLADFRARLKSEPSQPAVPNPEAFDGPIRSSHRRRDRRRSHCQSRNRPSPISPPRHQRHRRSPAHQSRPRPTFQRRRRANHRNRRRLLESRIRYRAR